VSRLATFVVGVALLAGVIVSGPPHQVQVRDYRALTRDYRLNHIAVVGDSYTTGTNLGGQGARAWTSRAFQRLGQQGMRIIPAVQAEGRAGYGVPGDHGSIFEDLTARAVKPDQSLVVFFGSRNDQGVPPDVLAAKTRETYDLARRFAPRARFLVIGPPWPTADVPPAMLQIRDVLFAAAQGAGAAWVDPIAEHWFVNRPDLIGPDGVHPNDAGHAYMAEMIAPLIGTQLVR
jgi:lysophospholipase L1-like esterase